MSQQAKKTTVAFTLNGEERSVQDYPLARLLDVLRVNCGLTGTKEGCGEGECGACSVFIDGVMVNSCLVPFVQVSGADVQTVEHVTADPANAALAKAFVTENGAQCGICTPGMVLASVALLRDTPDPTRDQVREALGGNLCRCTGYVKIIDAVQKAVAAGKEAQP